MLLIIKRKTIILICIILLVIILSSIIFKNTSIKKVFTDTTYNTIIQNNMIVRNNSILSKDIDNIKKLYRLDTKYGIWAYEHEINKMKYLHNWSEKQGIKFISIISNPIIKWHKNNGDKITLSLTVSTEYKYVYNDNKNEMNTFRIGTYHLMDIEKINEQWLISKDWYNDPFADILSLKDEKIDDIREIITNQQKKQVELNNRRIKAIEYADRFVGAADNGVNNYEYNKKYRNYNHLGGDCANFASQALHEGGEFKKTYSWNYIKEGTKSWVNAQAFKDYMIYSGRGRVLDYGDYNKVLKSSYKLLPGDFIAYQKKGKVVHISLVTGIDSKGYRLVNCHNTDRYRVPWDLGFSASKVRYWFVRMNY